MEEKIKNIGYAKYRECIWQNYIVAVLVDVSLILACFAMLFLVDKMKILIIFGISLLALIGLIIKFVSYIKELKNPIFTIKGNFEDGFVLYMENGSSYDLEMDREVLTNE